MVLRNFVGGSTAIEIARWLMFAGKFGVSAAFAVIWIFAAELFPTRYTKLPPSENYHEPTDRDFFLTKTFSLRTIALGMGSMSGRVGGILSPQINQLYNSVPWLPPLRG